MKRPSLRRIVLVVGLVILIASVIPFVLYAVPEAGGADQSFVVLSESMSPAIPLGSIVLVEEQPSPTAYREGDVITFRTGDEPVPTTHRIESVRETDDGRAFVTKGDANQDPDPSPVSPDQVLGEVTLMIPYAGHVIIFANSEYGFYALVALPLFLLLLDTVWRIATAGSGAGAESGDASGTGGQAATSTGGSSANATATANAGSDGESSSGTITITTTDLRATFVVLLLFTGYSAWTVTQLFTAVTTAVTVGIGFATLAVFGLLIAGRVASDSGDSGAVAESEATVSTGPTDRHPAVPPADDRAGGLEPSLDELIAGGQNESAPGERTGVPGGKNDDD
jgi:signal peptidase